MKKLTLSFPDEYMEKMRSMPEVNWQEVIKSGIIKRLEELEKFEELKRKRLI